MLYNKILAITFQYNPPYDTSNICYFKKLPIVLAKLHA